MVLIENAKSKLDKEGACFRPLAGIMVLITFIDMFHEDSTIGKFPSPCGDYGSYLKAFENEKPAIRKEFPSPCGDYGSYLIC